MILLLHRGASRRAEQHLFHRAARKRLPRVLQAKHRIERPIKHVLPVFDLPVGAV